MIISTKEFKKIVGEPDEIVSEITELVIQYRANVHDSSDKDDFYEQLIVILGLLRRIESKTPNLTKNGCIDVEKELEEFTKEIYEKNSDEVIEVVTERRYIKRKVE